MDVLLRCKIPLFLAAFFHEFSSGLLVIMSLEKLFVLHFPTKRSKFSTVKIAKRMSIGLAVFYILVNCPVIYLFKPLDTPFGRVCSFNSNYTSIFFKVSSLLYSFVPFGIIGMANMAIIYKFMKTKFDRGKVGTIPTNQALNKAGMRGTAILITVSLTFLVLTSPIAFSAANTASGTIQHTLLASVFATLSILNHAINSVLYSIVGTKFRNELMALLKCSTRSVGSVGPVAVIN